MKLGASFDFFLMGFVGFWNLLMEMIGLESLRIKLKQGGAKEMEYALVLFIGWVN